jgi:hypothetical protein
MNEAEAERGATKPDLTEKMRELRDAYLEIWSKHLIETVNSESYAEASGAVLNSYLNASAPFKEPAAQAMLQTLQQLHMPTSADFAGLAGRFTNVEMQLDNLDAKLDRVEKMLAGMKAAGTAEASVRQPKATPKPAPKGAPGPRAGGVAKAAKTAKGVRRNARKGK